MVFEESPESFWGKYAKFAIPVELLPSPYGYALIEALTPLGPIYAFDRGSPPTPVGRHDALFAAHLQKFRIRAAPAGLVMKPKGQLLLSGKIKHQLADGTYLYDIGIPFILNSYERLEPGIGVEVVTAPPLMLFRDEG